MIALPCAAPAAVNDPFMFTRSPQVVGPVSCENVFPEIGMVAFTVVPVVVQANCALTTTLLRLWTPPPTVNPIDRFWVVVPPQVPGVMTVSIAGSA